MCQKGFFITTIYTIRNHKTLTYFLVVANPLLGFRALVTGQNGCFELKLSGNTCTHQLSEISGGIFFLHNHCHGNHKSTIFLVTMTTITRKKLICTFHKTKYNKPLLKKLAERRNIFQENMSQNCHIWYVRNCTTKLITLKYILYFKTINKFS